MCPFGSGTNVVAGLLANMGAVGLGPYHSTNDPRTPNSYELVAFRELVLGLISETTMSLTPGTSIEATLLEFKNALIKLVPHGEKRPIFLKHPASALKIPQICQVFDTKLIYVLRPMKDIEVTRQRRNWSVGGTQAARIIYMHMFDHLVNRRSPTTIMRYTDLIESPVHYTQALAEFAVLEFDQRTLQQAASSILPRQSHDVGVRT